MGYGLVQGHIERHSGEVDTLAARQPSGYRPEGNRLTPNNPQYHLDTIKRETDTEVVLEIRLRPVLRRYSTYDRVGNPITVHRTVIPKSFLYAQLRPQRQPAEQQGEQPEQQQQEQQEQPGQEPQPGTNPQQQGEQNPNGGHTA